MNALAEISVTNARLPAAYEAAKVALANCASIDECQQWANKAEALASYAKQADDDTLRKQADRIQPAPFVAAASCSSSSIRRALARINLRTVAALGPRRKPQQVRVFPSGNIKPPSVSLMFPPMTSSRLSKALRRRP